MKMLNKTLSMLSDSFSSIQSHTNTTTAVSTFFAAPEAIILGATCGGKTAVISLANNALLSGLSLGEQFLDEKFGLSEKVGQYYKFAAPTVTAITSVGIKYAFSSADNKTTLITLSLLDLVKVISAFAIDNEYVKLDFQPQSEELNSEKIEITVNHQEL